MCVCVCVLVLKAKAVSMQVSDVTVCGIVFQISCG